MLDPWVADLDPLGVRAYPSPLTEAEVKSLCHPVKLVPACMVLHVSPWPTHSCVFVLQVSILETNIIFLKIFLKLELASPFSNCLFLISYSVKHLKIPEGSKQVFFCLAQTCVLPTCILRCFTKSGNKNELSEKELSTKSSIRNIFLYIFWISMKSHGKL